MFEHRVAYRFEPTESHPEGLLEGFVGWAFIAANAEAMSRRKIQNKLDRLGQTFDPARLIEDANGLTKKERSQMEADFAVSRRYEHI